VKKVMKNEQEWLLNNEKQLIDSELQRQQQLHEEKLMKDALYKKEHQTAVLK
jgi:hypothetical protein